VFVEVDSHDLDIVADLMVHVVKKETKSKFPKVLKIHSLAQTAVIFSQISRFFCKFPSKLNTRIIVFGSQGAVYISQLPLPFLAMYNLEIFITQY
jgi:hypothetical protein